MDPAHAKLKKLVEHALAANAQLPLRLVLEHFAPVAGMRDVARKHGLTPKGGFRLDAAPAQVMAQLLSEVKHEEVLAETLALLVPLPQPRKAQKSLQDTLDETRRLLSAREQAQHAAEQEAQRARESAGKAAARAEGLQNELDALERERDELRRQVEQLRAAPATATVALDRHAELQGLEHRAHALQQLCEGFRVADEALRKRQAFLQSQLRALESERDALLAEMPKGKRKKVAPLPEPSHDHRFLVPRFLQSFYKSLDNKDERTQRQAFEAVLLLCTEGFSYPSLETKPMHGQDLWSLRASLGLRVYFRKLADGGVECIELADREEQHTALRRLKEK